jgi:hypothetical protein
MGQLVWRYVAAGDKTDSARVRVEGVMREEANLEAGDWLRGLYCPSSTGGLTNAMFAIHSPGVSDFGYVDHTGCRQIEPCFDAQQ